MLYFIYFLIFSNLALLYAEVFETFLVEDRRCPPCHSIKINRRRQERCVYIQNCCRLRSSSIRCVVDPCLQFYKTCPRAAYCFQSNCKSTGCEPIYYDFDYNLIDSDKCNQFTLLNDTYTQAKPIVPSPRSNFPNGAIHINLPTYQPSEISQKPGGCPSRMEIIKVCTSECVKDIDCRRQEKCCWNGCANRCTASQQDPSNYFNMPIYRKNL